jgi:hypothetical protein
VSSILINGSTKTDQLRPGRKQQRRCDPDGVQALN